MSTTEKNTWQKDTAKIKAMDAFCHKNPVMILSTGKVGSTSLALSLEKHYEGASFKIEHIPLRSYEEAWLSEQFSPHKGSDFLDYILARYAKGEPVLNESVGNSETRLKIISPIRDPIGRDVSSFYTWGPGLLFGSQGPDWLEKFGALSSEELKARFLDSGFGSFSYSFFDTHVLPHIGIDVYAKPFPKERVAYYSHNKTDMMVMEYSLDDRVKAQLIKDFLGIKELKLGRLYVTSEQSEIHKESYERFKRTVRFDDDYLDPIFSSRYFRHFYTKKDEDRLRLHWSERPRSLRNMASVFRGWLRSRGWLPRVRS